MQRHILHVGFHKTGSTWLQRHVFPTIQGALYASDNRVIRELTATIAEDDVFMTETFRTALAEMRSRVFISRENLIGSPWHEIIPAEERAARLAKVAPNAYVVIVRREPDELARSLYAQYVQGGGYLAPAQYQRDVLTQNYLDQEGKVALFRSFFDDVLVLPYEQLRADRRGFLHKIEEFASVTFTIPRPNERSNPSLTGWRLQLLRHWNRAFRLSLHNPDPWIPLPGASRMRRFLQGQLS